MSLKSLVLGITAKLPSRMVMMFFFLPLPKWIKSHTHTHTQLMNGMRASPHTRTVVVRVGNNHRHMLTWSIPVSAACAKVLAFWVPIYWMCKHILPTFHYYTHTFIYNELYNNILWVSFTILSIDSVGEGAFLVCKGRHLAAEHCQCQKRIQNVYAHRPAKYFRIMHFNTINKQHRV